MSTRSWIIIPAVFALAGCGTNESTSSGSDEPRSDMPLQTASYYIGHKDDLAEMDKICTDWKGSQRPPMSWPSVIVNNCNSVDTAKTSIQNKAETEKLRREGAI